MQELAGRLAALDPDATAALRVIAYFDRLAEGRAGVESIVRGAAVLAGCPARLVDDDRQTRIRVGPDGRRDDRDDPADPRWPCTAVTPGGAARLWLERDGADGPVVPMVLERAAVAARTVLERTRARSVTGGSGDPAMVEVVLDGSAPEPDRRHAARVVGLGLGVAHRAVALGDPDEAQVLPAHGAPAAGRRAGVGPAVAVADLPASWAAARIALRFAADGNLADPGPQVVRAEALGGLAVLASVVASTDPLHPDVVALDRAAAEAPWMLATLHAMAWAPSLRAAAAELVLHHSTLQDRLARAEHRLGWTVREPDGRLRLQVAFLLRRLHRRT